MSEFYFNSMIFFHNKWIITVHNYWWSFIQKTFTITKEWAQVRIWEWFSEDEQEFMFTKIVHLSLNQSEPQLCMVFEVISPVCPSLRDRQIDHRCKSRRRYSFSYTCYCSIIFYSIFALQVIMNHVIFSSYVAYWN